MPETTHWVRPGIKPTSSWILVSFVNRWATKGTPGFYCYMLQVETALPPHPQQWLSQLLRTARTYLAKEAEKKKNIARKLYASSLSTLYFFGCTQSIWKSLGQGSSVSHSFGNARSLTHSATVGTRLFLNPRDPSTLSLLSLNTTLDHTYCLQWPV